MMDRGEYRSCFIAMADDADIHAMSGNAFKLLWMLKLTLPAAGIGVVYPGMLCTQVGCTEAELETLLVELEQPKPGSDHGWIQRDRNIVWVLNALACEPHMQPTNKNHRKSVARMIAKLPARSPVVQAFRSQYEEWFVASGTAEDGKAKASGTHSDGMAMGSEGAADQKHSRTEAEQSKSDAGDLDRADAGGDDASAEAGPGSATASPAAQEGGKSRSPLPPHAQQLLRERYDIRKGTPLTKRQEQVGRDMRATLDGVGAVLEKGVRVRAFNADHLDEACAHVLAKELANPDAAFQHVLLFLRDTYHERRTAAEKAAFGEGEDRARGAAPATPERAGGVIGEIGRRLLLRPTNAEEIAAASAWLAEQPDEVRTELAAAVDRALPASRNAPSTRAQLLSDATVDAFRRARDEHRGAA